jgi:hypothetical protein
LTILARSVTCGSLPALLDRADYVTQAAASNFADAAVSPMPLVRRWHDAQVSAAAGAGHSPGAGAGGRLQAAGPIWYLDACGLADRVRQRLEVVGLRDRGRELARVTYDLPAAGHRQADGVLLTHVIGMRLGKARERPDDGRRI